MTECWINVLHGYQEVPACFAFWAHSRERSVEAATNARTLFGLRPLYRLHITPKPTPTRV